MFDFKQFLNDCVAEGRRDIWGTDQVVSAREPTDYFDKAQARQSARAEIWQAIMDFREERIDFAELFMSLQAFDGSITPADVAKLLRRS